jgi:hypothetical protein
VDFEEAWKVSCLFLLGYRFFSTITFPANGQTIRRHTRVL